MTIRTTCIGAYPKPDYIEIGNFAESEEQDASVTRAFTYTHDDADQVAEELLIDATRAAIEDQLACGIDIPTVDYIQQRLELALRHIDAEHLLAAPDCGLMMLGRELAMTKLDNMCRAVQAIDRA